MCRLENFAVFLFRSGDSIGFDMVAVDGWIFILNWILIFFLIYHPIYNIVYLVHISS